MHRAIAFAKPYDEREGDMLKFAQAELSPHWGLDIDVYQPDSMASLANMQRPNLACIFVPLIMLVGPDAFVWL